jgi:hypothetical protein
VANADEAIVLIREHRQVWLSGQVAEGVKA